MIEDIRSQFPCLNQDINGKDFVFLDSAASAQKPKSVIDSLVKVLSYEYSNVHRGAYHLSEVCTTNYENTRKKVAEFLNANENEIVFTKGTTESINLIASSLGRNFSEDDEIIITELEHHANIVPWQQLNCKLKIAKISDDGILDVEYLKSLISKNTKLISIVHVSNALGVINPVEEVISIAKEHGVLVLVDACQSIVHSKIDVKKLNPDFLVFSGHKLYGPNGVGILYGKYDILDKLPPYQTGGEMIDQVSFDKTSFRNPPYRFEAGTPAIAEVIAFAKSIDFLQSLDLDLIHDHEEELHQFLNEEILKLDNFKIIGKGPKKSIISFIHNKAHPNDIGSIVDNCGVAIRTGHHCAQPLMNRMGLTSTARASIAMYNNFNDIEIFIDSLKKVDRFF